PDKVVSSFLINSGKGGIGLPACCCAVSPFGPLPLPSRPPCAAGDDALSVDCCAAAVVASASQATEPAANTRIMAFSLSPCGVTRTSKWRPVQQQREDSQDVPLPFCVMSVSRTGAFRNEFGICPEGRARGSGPLSQVVSVSPSRAFEGAGRGERPLPGV